MWGLVVSGKATLHPAFLFLFTGSPRLMLQTATDVYDRVRTEIGKLARRVQEELMTPTPSDEDALEIYVEDALAELATRTERFRDVIRTSTTEGQAWVARPPHMHRLDVVTVYDDDASYDLDKDDGRHISQWARAPDASTGRPTKIGAHAQRLYLYPVPDDAYPVELTITLNGHVEPEPTVWFFYRSTQLYPTTTTSADRRPPTLEEMIQRVPSELHRAFVAYVTSEWLLDIGRPNVAERPAQRYERDLRRYSSEPASPSTTSRDYNPLGL